MPNTPIRKFRVLSGYKEGDFYDFQYNPTQKGRLPYYDIYPFFLCMGGEPNYGIVSWFNLNYLPKNKIGIKLIDELFDLINIHGLHNIKTDIKFLERKTRTKHHFEVLNVAWRRYDIDSMFNVENYEKNNMNFYIPDWSGLSSEDKDLNYKNFIKHKYMMKRRKFQGASFNRVIADSIKNGRIGAK